MTLTNLEDILRSKLSPLQNEIFHRLAWGIAERSLNAKFKSFASATAHIKAAIQYKRHFIMLSSTNVLEGKICFACFYSSAIILALKRSFVCMLSSFIVNDLKYVIKQKSER